MKLETSSTSIGQLDGAILHFNYTLVHTLSARLDQDFTLSRACQEISRDAKLHFTSIDVKDAQNHHTLHNTMASHARVRSLYRSFLRELPARSPSILANPSPLQKHIRSDFSTAESSQHSKLQEAEQHIQYLKAQRMYTTLLERYNPGMNMDEEERVRLTARRVGMNLPIEMGGGEGKGQR